MSGGHFLYQQHKITDIADDIQQIIEENDSEEVNEWGDKKGYHFTPNTIAQMTIGLFFLRIAYIYAQRIDWLVSGDDGEDCFIRRLDEDFAKLESEAPE